MSVPGPNIGGRVPLSHSDRRPWYSQLYSQTQDLLDTGLSNIVTVLLYAIVHGCFMLVHGRTVPVHKLICFSVLNFSY